MFTLAKHAECPHNTFMINYIETCLIWHVLYLTHSIELLVKDQKKNVQRCTLENEVYFYMFFPEVT